MVLCASEERLLVYCTDFNGFRHFSDPLCAVSFYRLRWLLLLVLGVHLGSLAESILVYAVDQYNMVVLTSRTWRNLSAKVIGSRAHTVCCSVAFQVFGVRIMVPDPLEKQRIAVVEHAAKAEVIDQQ